MAADTAAGDGEAELLAIVPTTLAGVELEPGASKPGDGQVLQSVADREDAEQPTVEVGAGIFRGVGEFELQGPLAGVTEP